MESQEQKASRDMADYQDKKFHRDAAAAEFSLSRRMYIWQIVLSISTVFLSIATVALAGFTYLQAKDSGIQIQAAENAQSAQLVLSLSAQLNGPQFTKIMTAIEANPHTYSPLKAGFTLTQLENYMGQFETIGDLMRDGVITQEMAYDEFSYDAEKAYCNQDVKNDIASDRLQDGITTGTDAYFSGFEDMTNGFLAQDKLTCASPVLDNQ